MGQEMTNASSAHTKIIAPPKRICVAVIGAGNKVFIRVVSPITSPIPHSKLMTKIPHFVLLHPYKTAGKI